MPDLSRTSICPDLLLSGSCPKGPECTHAHAVKELKATPAFYKTSVCVFHAKGSCKLGSDCRYAHRNFSSLDEQRAYEDLIYGQYSLVSNAVTKNTSQMNASHDHLQKDHASSNGMTPYLDTYGYGRSYGYTTCGDKTCYESCGDIASCDRTDRIQFSKFDSENDVDDIQNLLLNIASLFDAVGTA